MVASTPSPPDSDATTRQPRNRPWLPFGGSSPRAPPSWCWPSSGAVRCGAKNVAKAMRMDCCSCLSIDRSLWSALSSGGHCLCRRLHRREQPSQRLPARANNTGSTLWAESTLNKMAPGGGGGTDVRLRTMSGSIRKMNMTLETLIISILKKRL